MLTSHTPFLYVMVIWFLTILTELRQGVCNLFSTREGSGKSDPTDLLEELYRKQPYAQGEDSSTGAQCAALHTPPPGGINVLKVELAFPSLAQQPVCLLASFLLEEEVCAPRGNWSAFRERDSHTYHFLCFQFMT